MNRADRKDFEAHYEGPRDWYDFPEEEERMSKMTNKDDKNRDRCTQPIGNSITQHRLTKEELLEAVGNWFLLAQMHSQPSWTTYAQIKEIIEEHDNVASWMDKCHELGEELSEVKCRTSDQQPTVSREWICKQVDYWWNDCGFGGRIQPEKYDIKGMVLDLFKELVEVTDE